MYFNRNFPNLEYFSESRKKIRRKKVVGGEKEGDIQGTGWPLVRGLGSNGPLLELCWSPSGGQPKALCLTRES